MFRTIKENICDILRKSSYDYKDYRGIEEKYLYNVKKGPICEKLFLKHIHDISKKYS